MLQCFMIWGYFFFNFCTLCWKMKSHKKATSNLTNIHRSLSGWTVSYANKITVLQMNDSSSRILRINLSASFIVNSFKNLCIHGQFCPNNEHLCFIQRQILHLRRNTLDAVVGTWISLQLLLLHDLAEICFFQHRSINIWRKKLYVVNWFKPFEVVPQICRIKEEEGGSVCVCVRSIFVQCALDG